MTDPKSFIPPITDIIIEYHVLQQISAEEEQMGRLRAHRRYEYWTCLRFVPWTKSTRADYGLDHNNYLKHVDNNG